MRTQFAALCYRIRDGKVQILLVTSRRTRRWIVPKGWPMEGRTPAACAVQEAWEEGGVKGRASGPCLGVYAFAKGKPDTADLNCLAMLYPVQVKRLSKTYPERHQRKRRWVSRKKAAHLVVEPELSRLIKDFDPRRGTLADRP